MRKKRERDRSRERDRERQFVERDKEVWEYGTVCLYVEEKERKQ